MSDELKPCPFCGGDPSVTTILPGGYKRYGCNACAINACSLDLWNSRAESADLAAARAEAARMSEILSEARGWWDTFGQHSRGAPGWVCAIRELFDATPAPPPAPAWTSERPTVPGLYWTYNDISEEVFPVILVKHELPLPNGGCNHHKLPLSDWGWSHNQFVGPITPPPAPCPASEATEQGPA